MADLNSQFDAIWGTKTPAPGAPTSSRADEIMKIAQESQQAQQVQQQNTKVEAPGSAWMQKNLGMAGDYLGNVWNDYYNYSNELMHPIKSFAEPNMQNGQGTIRATAGTSAKIFNDTLGTVFAPITEGINSLVKPLGISKESPLNPIVQGTVMGSAEGHPIVGAIAGGMYSLSNIIMEQPKIKAFLDQNPDVRNDIQGVMNAVPAILGAKFDNKGVMEKPMGEALPEMGKNFVESAKVPVEAIKGAKNLANTLAKFTTSQATGMSPETISRILSNPEDFSPSVMKTFTREGVASEALGNINTRLENLSETGSEYKGVRDAKTPVNIPKGAVDGILKKYGINVDTKGILKFDKESLPTSPGDRTALQEWYSTFGKDQEHTSNSFLNARKGLDNLAQWDSSKTDAANVLAMDLRKTLNNTVRNQIPGLEDLDTRFTKETSELKQIKKDYFKPDGTLKDNAISKIANLTGKGKENVLGRLEQVSPGIGEKIVTLKAVEDIQAASGQKVGTYGRAAVAGGSLVTGNIPGIVAAILASPEIATQVLRGYGKVLGVKDVALEKIVSSYEDYKANPKMGLSVERVNDVPPTGVSAENWANPDYLKAEMKKLGETQLAHQYGARLEELIKNPPIKEQQPSIETTQKMLKVKNVKRNVPK